MGSGRLGAFWAPGRARHGKEDGTMKVREAMAKTISTAGPNDTVGRVAELMKAEDCGASPTGTPAYSPRPSTT